MNFQAIGATFNLLDYNTLKSALEGYKAPQRKVTALLKSGDLIRIRKGLYAIGKQHRSSPICQEYVANLIYGPSYVSCEYALGFYGLIPERVEMITSVTTKRNKRYQTPLGDYDYQHLNPARFSVGVNWETGPEGVRFLIAGPEKAIVDAVAKHSDIAHKQDMRNHLFDNLRIDYTQLSDLDQTRFKKIASCYRRPVVTLLYNTLKELQKWTD